MDVHAFWVGKVVGCHLIGVGLGTGFGPDGDHCSIGFLDGGFLLKRSSGLGLGSSCGQDRTGLRDQCDYWFR